MTPDTSDIFLNIFFGYHRVKILHGRNRKMTLKSKHICILAWDADLDPLAKFWMTLLGPGYQRLYVSGHADCNREPSAPVSLREQNSGRQHSDSQIKLAAKE